MKTIFSTLVLLFSSLAISATEPRAQGPDDQALQLMLEHNLQQAAQEPLGGRTLNNNVLPFAEYQDTGYIFFDATDFSGYAREIKNTIAQTLPEETKLVVYTTSSSTSQAQSLRNHYEQFISSDRLIILSIPDYGSNAFWSRDGLPVPVWNQGQLGLVDARYYHGFEPDDFLAELFGVLKSENNYFFEGGNFMANAVGDCIVVNRRRSYMGGTSDTAAIPDSVFEEQYGCKRLIRLRHLKGIGHTDEVVKFMGDNLVVTDTEEYVELLESHGFDVRVLPEGPGSYETYVNSLIVNNTLYLPVFGSSRDAIARQVYEDLGLGLRIVPINSKQIANRGQGGIHCITMNYPPAPLAELLGSLGITLN